MFAVVTASWLGPDDQSAPSTCLACTDGPVGETCGAISSVWLLSMPAAVTRARHTGAVFPRAPLTTLGAAAAHAGEAGSRHSSL